MLLKLEEQYPGTPIDILFCWANMSRNCLQMWHGFSSFGENPNLPNIMIDHLPALEGTTNSEALDQHLTSLHIARKTFIQSETDERIRRALRSKHGDKVYY